MTPGMAEQAEKTFASFKAAGGDAEGIERIDDPIEAEKVRPIGNLILTNPLSQGIADQGCSIRLFMGRLHPLPLETRWVASSQHKSDEAVAHIVQRCLDLGLNLQTWTPVTSIAPSDSSDSWVISTPRGEITTPTIIHATNAYAPALLPETHGAIRPTPHMSA